MNNYFEIDDVYDHEIVVNFKREANIVLASLTGIEKVSTINKYKDVLRVLQTIYNMTPAIEENISFILNTINTVSKHGLLSPLTLQDDEFDDKLKTFRINNRYPYIWKDSKGTIFNNNAFNVYLRSYYSHIEKIQLNINPELILTNNRIYISKGGVVGGEYIENCIIPKKIVDKKCFTIQSVINIPASKIINEETGDFIYVVDHREPKVKTLREFYEVPICFDENIKQYKYNIRNYKKIKNEL